MYMRFRGDGIGHVALVSTRAQAADGDSGANAEGAGVEELDEETDTEPDVPAGASERTLASLNDVAGEGADETDSEESDDEDGDEGEEDYGYLSGEREDDDESSSDEEDSDDGLGAEDGEDGEYDRDIDVAGRDAVL